MRGKDRADKLLVAAGLAPSRERARALILAGKVKAGGARVEKAGDLLPLEASLSVDEDPFPYVSRGGVKLAHALDRFGVSPSGRRCLDAGASTGGFTDCLLQRGARSVVAVDVGQGQLDWKLQQDPRVTRLDRTNARELAPEQVGERPSLVTADVAFISLEKVLPALVRCAPEAEFVVLVKPQFEAGREHVGKGGVVRDPAAWRECLGRVARCFEGLGLRVAGATASPLLGPAGNREFFVHAVPERGDGIPDALLDAAVEEGRRLGSRADGGEP